MNELNSRQWFGIALITIGGLVLSLMFVLGDQLSFKGEQRQVTLQEKAKEKVADLKNSVLEKVTGKAKTQETVVTDDRLHIPLTEFVAYISALLIVFMGLSLCRVKPQIGFWGALSIEIILGVAAAAVAAIGAALYFIPALLNAWPIILLILVLAPLLAGLGSCMG